MSKILITGDVHGSEGLCKLSKKNFPYSDCLTKEDVMIICGDCGFMWDESTETRWWDDWAEQLPFTVIGAFGNHENYNVIRTLPLEEWNGAKVRKVRPHVMYVENGEIMTLNDKTFFFMGGATSVDKIYRKEGKSWWPQEIPSYQEMEYAANNLRARDFKVDYIITHCAPNYVINQLFKYSPQYDDITNFLEKFVHMTTEFKRWFMGHYHIDYSLEDRKYEILYNDILEITPEDDWRLVG